jgi:spore maturation protein CgeB
MPHATDPDVFNAGPDPAAAGVVFVGISNKAQAADKRRVLAPRPDLLAAADAALDAGRVCRETILQGLESLVDPTLVAACDSEERRNLELYMIYEQTSRSRVDLVRRLLPLGIEVCGDGNWRAVLPRVHGEISYFQGMPAHYRSTAVNLNITSVQMPLSVNQRVFDCPAAGGFLVTDAQEDLFSFFDPDTELVTYASLDELEDKVRYFADRPDERARIVNTARKRILAEHTHAHRLQALEAYLRERYA